jgi:hypothetical protein
MRASQSLKTFARQHHRDRHRLVRLHAGFHHAGQSEPSRISPSATRG